MDTNVNTICRSQMYFKIGVLKNFAIFTGKHLFCSLYLCEILRNTFFYRTTLLAASDLNRIQRQRFERTQHSLTF